MMRLLITSFCAAKCAKTSVVLSELFCIYSRGRPQVERARRAVAHIPENDNVICYLHAKYPKIFIRAFGSRNKKPEIEKAHEKFANISVSAFGEPQNGQFLMFAVLTPPPLWKISTGAHVCSRRLPFAHSMLLRRG